MMAAGWCGRIGGSTMPCESCAVQFSVFKRKRACCECDRYYCSGCLRRGGGMCAPCRLLSTRPTRDTIASLKVRDLQCFLQRQNVSTRGCVEKEELVRLCESHVNSTTYRRRGQRAGASPFSSFKGFTNNINDLITSAFDLRNGPTPHQAPPPPARGFSNDCFNTAHAHASAPPPYNLPPTTTIPRPNNLPPTTTPPRPNPERFNLRPGGEPDIRVSVPDLSSSSVSRSTSDENARVDTADCFEVEDIDEAGWEFVNRPADPLPNDSTEILVNVTSRLAVVREPRAASELDLSRLEPADNTDDTNTDSASLQDEPLARDDPSESSSRHDPSELSTRHDPSEFSTRHDPSEHSTRHDPSEHSTRHDNTDTNFDSVSLPDEPVLQHDTSAPGRISLEQFKEPSELELLNVKQLKELLTRNRVEYRGCLERADLLQRAKTLWRNHQLYRDDVENMPIEECCKICMAAPLECVLLECGHIAACTRCAKQLAECPICRQYVVRAVRFFRS